MQNYRDERKMSRDERRLNDETADENTGGFYYTNSEVSSQS
jgi:hypothetical protein